MKNQNGIMISCKKATELVDMKQAGKIGFISKIKLKMHLLMCNACKTYEKQSLLLAKMFDKSLHKSKNINPDPNEMIKLKRKIKANL